MSKSDRAATKTAETESYDNMGWGGGGGGDALQYSFVSPSLAHCLPLRFGVMPPEEWKVSVCHSSGTIVAKKIMEIG